ncbi:NAD(P)-dependent oxidoreductase [Bifidobacterium sp. ESL0763]|uniref:NAD(P)-dependent oxidoreductase n=1 Tax=Bifidobacterium sp. ESL0763 TaxID=2983227 RepID=UPI0023F840DF|nr:NAD(P)-dependent oxidoreductase [Bifidobacterium sp. ESL0763]MDF7663601.1 NAD(P)-dependent oxidoreductase [Bifidobacterium sp. ESL0763]
MDYIETQPERTDLPLVVVPTMFEAMYRPLASSLRILHDVARVRMYKDFNIDADTIVERCAQADTVMVIGFHVNGPLLEKLADHVRCFVFGGTGVSNFIDLKRTRELGIRVCNTVHYGDETVAEYTFALILELARGVGAMDRGIRAGNWSGREGFALKDKTLGIIGFGGIGQSVARIADGFGMRTMVWNSHVNAATARSLGTIRVDTIAELMAHSDIVSLHLPLNEETDRVITADDLEKLRPGSLLINTARAELIEDGALVSRLGRGDIRAALDVFDKEPLPADDPLRSVPGVILTPHVAWRADDAYHDMSRQVARSILAFYNGERFNVVE